MFKPPTLANRLLNETVDGCGCGLCLLHRQAAKEIERLTKLLEHRPPVDRQPQGEPDYTDTRVES